MTEVKYPGGFRPEQNDGRALRPVNLIGTPEQVLPTGAQKGPSKQEMQILDLITERGYPEPRTEYRFARHLKRQYKFDFAWPEIMAAVEYEGGIFVQGWHQTAEGITDDAEKNNLAVALGWRVYRITALMMKERPHKVTRALGYWLDVIHGRVTIERAAL